MITENPRADDNRNGAREKRLHHWQGIKFFQGSPLPDINILRNLIPTVTVDCLRETRHVWRPEEAIEAGKLFFGLEGASNQRSGVHVIGEPQSGKGTFLFGISDMCDALGIGYVFIDGHHQEVDGTVVSQTITQAQKMSIPIFFDSTDYLFLKSRKTGRSISKEAQEKRTQSVVTAIDETTIPIAVTSHDEEWAGEFLDLQLRERYHHAFNRFPRYVIPLRLQSEASIRRFLLDHKIPDEGVAFLLSMHKDKFVIGALYDFIKDLYYPSFCPNPTTAVDSIFAAIWTYPVLKNMARDYADHTIKLINTIMAQRKTDELAAKKAIGDLGLFILNLDEDRRNLTEIRRKKHEKITLN